MSKSATSDRAETYSSNLGVAPGLMALRPRIVWNQMVQQPFSVWATAVYLFFEYVRPQSIYPWLGFLPFARISLVSAIIATLWEMNRTRKWQLIDTGMALFSLIVIASIFTAYQPAYGMERLDIYLSWVIVYTILSTSISTLTRLILILLGWFLWNLKMSLFAFRSWASIGFAFRDWGVSGAPGWFQNSGEFGIQMCVVLPISLFFCLGVKKHVSRRVFAGLLVLPITAVTGAIASSSRGALLGIAGVGIWMLLRSRHRLRGLFALATFVALVYVVLPAEQRSRLSASGDDTTSVNRLTYWTRGISIANSHPFLGIGYSNWLPYYASIWSGRLEENEGIELPHNVFVECVAELGYTGLFALIFLIFGTFRMNRTTRKRARNLGADGVLAENLAWGFDGALVGYLVSGFFVTVLYYPYLWVNLGMTAALHLCVAKGFRAARLDRRSRTRARTVYTINADDGPIPGSA